MNRLFSTAMITTLFFFACRQRHTESEIIAALQRYDRLIQKTDGDSIALLYTVDGELGSVAKGRDSIRKFLSGFKNFTVLLQRSSTDSLSFAGDSAVQKGRYRQVTVVPAKDTLRLSGSYRATWQWVSAEGWRIRRMHTMPDK